LINFINSFKILEVNFRLPSNLKPSLYELTIKPYIGTNETYQEKAFTYEGTMKMTFECLNATNKIIFHSSGNDIEESSLLLLGGSKPLTIVETMYDDVTEFFTLILNDECDEMREYSLSIKYSGSIRDDLEGFYLSSYKDVASNTTK
jgi:hypothetical protein